MVDAYLLHRVVDGVDQFLEACLWFFFEDSIKRAGVFTELRLRPDSDDRIARHQGIVQAFQGGRSKRIRNALSFSRVGLLSGRR